MCKFYKSLRTVNLTLVGGGGDLYLPDLIAFIVPPFDPEEDAHKLISIMKEGRHGDLIIFYLSTIPNAWRQEIADVFFYDFGRNLTNDLQCLLPKEVQDLILAIMLPPAKYRCEMLNRYLNEPGADGTDERLLLEILCTITKPEIAEIVETYEIMYDRPLAEHLSSETPDDFRRLLTHIVTGARYEDRRADYDRAWEAVLMLDYEGPAGWGEDEGTFVKILANESFSMIRLIFILYKTMVGRDVEEVVRGEILGERRDALSAIVNCIMYPSAWLATKIHGVMDGTDPDGNAMVRIIVGRAERDLVPIHKAYKRLYNKTLQGAITEFAEWESREKRTCSCLGIVSFRRFVSMFYKTRDAAARNIAKKILFFTLILDDVS